MNAKYEIKCDECKTTIGRTASIRESAAGGHCDACRIAATMTTQKIGNGMFLAYNRGSFAGAIGGSRGEWTAFPADGTEAGFHSPLVDTFATKDAALAALATA